MKPELFPTMHARIASCAEDRFAIFAANHSCLLLTFVAIFAQKCQR